MHLTAPSHWSRSIGTGGRDPSERVVTIVGMRTPARVVFYQSRTGYAGQDHVKYEVTGEDGESRRVRHDDFGRRLQARLTAGARAGLNCSRALPNIIGTHNRRKRLLQA
jgi:hypothetical protein